MTHLQLVEQEDMTELIHTIDDNNFCAFKALGECMVDCLGSCETQDAGACPVREDD
jgi:hypothetical protein